MNAKRLLLIVTCLLIGTEGVIAARFAPMDLPNFPLKSLNGFVQSFGQAIDLAGVNDYAGHLKSEMGQTILGLGLNIQKDSEGVANFANYFAKETARAFAGTGKDIGNDLSEAASIASGMADQAQKLAQSFWSDTKAPYLAAANVLSPSLNNQSQQFSWAIHNSTAGWNNLLAYYGQSLAEIYKINSLAFKNQIQTTNKLAINIWNTATGRNDGNGSTAKSQIAQTEIAAINNQRTWPVSPRGEEPQVLGIAITPNTSKTINTVQFTGLSSLDVEKIMNERLDEYTKFLAGFWNQNNNGLVVTNNGNGLVSNENGNTTAIIGNTPIVTYVPPVQSTGFGGGSLAGFTSLSSDKFTTQTAVINSTLNVVGASTLTSLNLSADLTVAGNTTFTGNLTLATSTLSTLTVVGPTTLNTLAVSASSTLATTTISNLTLTQPLALSYGGLGFDASGVAKGGIFAGTGSGTLGIQTVGADGLCLLASSTAVSGLAWTNCAVAANAITSLGGLTNPVQSFATGTATGIGLNIISSGSTHTFNPTVSSGYVIPLSASTTEWSSFYNTPSGRITAANNLLWTGNTLGVAAGYNIPLTASTTNWNGFYDAPSTRITAGTNMAWAGNTLNGLSDSAIRSLLSSSATGLTYTSGTGDFSLTSGYTIPLTASTTNWNNFYSTPSGQITSGTGLSWSGNTLNSVWTASGNNIYNNNSGNIGIGTTTVNSRVVIQGSTSDSSASALSVVNSGATGLMTILNNGNVGIGTTNPTAKLEVNGLINTTNAGTNFGDINAGSAGVYSFNGPSRYVRFNTNGGANDFMSSGSTLVINYQGAKDTHGSLPQNVEFFGDAVAATPSTVFVNGNVSLGGGAFLTTPTNTRTLTVQAGASQSTTALLDVKDNGGTNHWLYVKGDGNVGIGTTSPSAKLSIGSAASGGNVRIANGWLCVDDNDTCTGATTAGTIYATNGTVSGGADVAENYPTLDSLEPGDVVSANPGFPVHVSKGASTSAVLGIVSTKPGVLLGNNNDYPNASSVPVALAGRVPTKVTNENGSIKIGDFLTASKQFPGYAMKATEPGQVFGRALENFNSATPSSSGKILVFIQFTYNQPNIAEMLQNGQNSGNFELTEWLSTLTNINQTQAAAFGDIVVTGSVAIQKDLHVKGVIYAATLEVDTITAKKINSDEVNSKEVNTDKVNTDQVCIKDVCIGYEQLKSILEKNNTPSAPVATPPPTPPPSPTPTDSGQVAGDSTPPSPLVTPTPEVIPTPTPTEAPSLAPDPTPPPPAPSPAE